MNKRLLLASPAQARAASPLVVDHGSVSRLGEYVRALQRDRTSSWEYHVRSHSNMRRVANDEDGSSGYRRPSAACASGERVGVLVALHGERLVTKGSGCGESSGASQSA